LNWYDLLASKTVDDSKMLKGEDRYREVVIDGETKRYKRGRTMSEYTPWMNHVESGEIFGDALTDYINSKPVRDALNIPTSVQAFEMCKGE
jgi:hypothetical protein